VQRAKPFATAVVDDRELLKASSRVDGAPPLSRQVAQDTAYTLVGFGLLTTRWWHDFIEDDPPPAGGRGGAGGARLA
jgi:uncharacterized protein GlcG (DUF336 family)